MILASAALALLVSVGVAFLFTGLVRRIGSVSMLLSVFGSVAVATIVWVAIGHTLEIRQLGRHSPGEGAHLPVVFALVAHAAPRTLKVCSRRSHCTPCLAAISRSATP